VDAAWRGQGIGTALIEHVLTEAALAALDTVVILTARARGFFARFGFREVSAGEVPDPVARAVARGDAPTSAAIPMQLRLAES
jgi:N-acetylglutamate synthase-like GNAT family acetyltransferase